MKDDKDILWPVIVRGINKHLDKKLSPKGVKFLDNSEEQIAQQIRIQHDERHKTKLIEGQYSNLLNDMDKTLNQDNILMLKERVKYYNREIHNFKNLDKYSILEYKLKEIEQNLNLWERIKN